MACKLANSHLQDRSQQVQELATISEPRARYIITPIRAIKCRVRLDPNKRIAWQSLAT